MFLQTPLGLFFGICYLSFIFEDGRLPFNDYLTGVKEFPYTYGFAAISAIADAA